jgi:hypothetical protein
MHKLKLDIYECTIYLHIVNTNKDVSILTKEIIKKHKLKYKIVEEAWGYTVRTLCKYYMILSRESLKDYNTYLHELSHLIDSILEDRNIKDGEARAYLQGHIGNHFLNIINNEKHNSNSGTH